MVTIVIPCYNVAKYIKRCIDSLVGQSFQKFKVILVDDKSTDDTYQYLLQLQATSGLDIMVLQNSCNSGPAVSRNNGILKADTKYITFCDSDDWYEPDFLKTMVTVLTIGAAACGAGTILGATSILPDWVATDLFQLRST